jgi:hypothetical protein
MASQPNRDSTLVWQRSSASADGGNCVEVARSESSVLVRDSAARSGAMLAFSPAQWQLFVRLIQDGKLALG